MSALSAIAASGLLYYFSTNLGTLWPVAWIAPAPVLWYALGHYRPVRAALVAFAAFFAGQIALVPVYWTIVPVGTLLVALAIPAAAFAGVVFLTGRYGRALPPAAGILLFPALWTAWEYVFSLFSPNGTFLSVAYSQVPFLTIIQVASVAGMAAITFLVSLPAASIAFLLRVKPLRLSYAVVPMCLLMLALGFGTVSLLRSDTAPRVRVGLAARDGSRLGYGTTDRSVAVEAAGAYAQAIEELARRGVEVVLLPEACVTLRPEWEADVRTFLSEIASSARVLVVIGFDEFLPDGTRRNVAEVISRTGSLVGRYVKHRHLPGQDYEVGAEILELPGRVGVSICKDLDFPALGLRYSQAGTGLLLVPAWDFGKDGRLHSQMAWLRGVEGGYAVARCAVQGLLSVTDSKGAPVAVSESGSATEVLLSASVRIGPGNTLYARTGDIFAIACVLLAAGIVVSAELWRNRKQHRRATAQL